MRIINFKSQNSKVQLKLYKLPRINEKSFTSIIETLKYNKNILQSKHYPLLKAFKKV